MPVPFTPRDLNAFIWYSADKRQIVFHPGSTERVRKLESLRNGDWPLTGFDHADDPLVPFKRSPILSAALGNSLSGRPTLVFPGGAYLKAATRAWTSYWNTPEPGSPWDYNSNPEGEATYNYETERHFEFAFPAESNVGFVLMRASPPAISPSSSYFTDGGFTGLYDLSGEERPARPHLFGSMLGYDSNVGTWPVVRILDWDPTNPAAPGTLELVAQAEPFVEPDDYNAAYGTIRDNLFAQQIPFDRFGQWTLFEWRTRVVAPYVFPGGTFESTGVCEWRINGKLVATMPLVNHDYNNGPNFHLFGSSINEGAFGDTRTMDAYGNVAEVVIAPGEPTDDELAKTRAWIVRKWGLESILQGQPHVSSPYVPGGDPAVPQALPGVRPTARAYTPGDYANTAFSSIGGIERSVRHGRTVYAGDRLSLSYRGLSEDEVAAFRAHYELHRGGYGTFGLHPEALVNLGPIASHLNRSRTSAEYAPRGSSWAYVSEPTVDNRQLDVNELSIELELLPEPFRIAFPTEESEVEVTSDFYPMFVRQMDGAAEVEIEVGGEILAYSFNGEASVEIASVAGLSYSRSVGSLAATVAVESPADLFLVFIEGDAAAVEIEVPGDLVFEVAPGWLVSSGVGAPFLGSGAATTTTGWTTLVNAYGDDTAVSLALPFVVKMSSTVFSSIGIGSNGYVTFGGTASTLNPSAGNPALDKILFLGGDRAYARVLYQSSTDDPLKWLKIRWEGRSVYTLSFDDVFLEITLFNDPYGQGQLFEVRYGNCPIAQELSVASATTFYATTGSTTLANRSFVLSGNVQASAFSILADSRVVHS